MSASGATILAALAACGAKLKVEELPEREEFMPPLPAFAHAEGPNDPALLERPCRIVIENRQRVPGHLLVEVDEHRDIFIEAYRKRKEHRREADTAGDADELPGVHAEKRRGTGVREAPGSTPTGDRSGHDATGVPGVSSAPPHRHIYAV